MVKMELTLIHHLLSCLILMVLMMIASVSTMMTKHKMKKEMHLKELRVKRQHLLAFQEYGKVVDLLMEASPEAIRPATIVPQHA